MFRVLLGIPALARLMPTDPQQQARLAVLAFLHDFGKCNWGFQAKASSDARETAGHVLEALTLLRHDGLYSAWPPKWESLISDIRAWFVNGDEEAFQMLLAAISHHGMPVSDNDAAAAGAHRLDRFWKPHDKYDPMLALAELAHAARMGFPEAFGEAIPPMAADARRQQRFAGLVMLADWIGSDTQFFPYRISPEEDRRALTEAASRHALSAIGLLQPAIRAMQSIGTASDFRRTFDLDSDAQPTPLQVLLTRDLPIDDASRLVLIESETGSGKTEAALAWFLRLYASGKVDGLYFALPTRVAARELYGRVLRTVDRAFTPECRPVPVLLAAPGYVRVDGEPVLIEPEGALWEDDEQSRRRARLWAAERPKRFLAAPIAVGTIDQALLSVLKVKHSLLRSVCLDRHLLVVDEVHASDTYMGELLRSLLEGHLARGGWALLLSATLGESAAAGFFGREPRALANAIDRPYPSVTMRTAELGVPSGGAGRNIDVELIAKLDDNATFLERLAKALGAGARVLVICNTVGRANALLRAVEGYFSTCAPVLLNCIFALNGVRGPHHGRFAREDREQLDFEVSRRLGKSASTDPLLLIGTQTLEQSLDLDADWLVTDLAPMDVLLQRLGRLHRHARMQRPAEFATPRALVRVPDQPLESFLRPGGQLRGPAGLGPVYADGRVLACTMASLASEPRLVIPDQNRRRVETTTHPGAWVRLPPVWNPHVSYMEGEFLADLRQADRSVLRDELPFGELHYGGDEERVLTRLGDPSYELRLRWPCRSPFGVCIERIAMPARWLRGVKPPEVVDVAPSDDGFVLEIGSRSFRYTRFGLERNDA